MGQKNSRWNGKILIILLTSLFLVFSATACPTESIETPAPPGSRDIIIPPFSPTETSPLTTPSETTAPPIITPPNGFTTPSPFTFPPTITPPRFDSIGADMNLRGVFSSPLQSPTILLSGVDVTTSVSIANFILVDRIGQTSIQGGGHLLYFIDVDPPIIPGVPAVTAEGTYAASTITRFTWTDVTPGIHIFSVELVNNDNTPLQPPVVASIKIRVPQPIEVTAPMINSVILSKDPASSPVPNQSPTPVVGMDVNLSTRISNFNLTTSSVPDPTPGRNRGHVLYSMDVSEAVPGTSPSLQIIPSAIIPSPETSNRVQESVSLVFTWPNVPPGLHTFRIELVNQDNTPLDPRVYYEFAITIPAITQ